MNVPGGGSITTYQGGLFLLCPRSLEAEFKRLRDGETPDDWDAAWIAAGQRQSVPVGKIAAENVLLGVTV